MKLPIAIGVVTIKGERGRKKQDQDKTRPVDDLVNLELNTDKIVKVGTESRQRVKKQIEAILKSNVSIFATQAS
ncbi:conserved hypothetical protein [Ricinus communis]|uniref:Uncharacterized protein n=1 Tax=Ricinus communis TaxID=3988 RepID=B9SA64_RICCO|nr:conserved hypothetical protein [Ricinus communis]